MRYGICWRRWTHRDSTKSSPCLLFRRMKGDDMNKADLPFLSAAALAELIRRREVSPLDATEAYLERIEAVDGKLHSYITICREDALQAARQAEAAIGRGTYAGPLHGLPFAAKDQFWT